MRNDKGQYPAVLIMFVMSALMVFVWSSNAQAQKSRAAVNAAPAVIQQPLYTEYRGVRLGMTATEVQTKLGSPTFMDKELGYFVVSPTETAQIAFDAAGKVRVISVDYQNGAGAPEPRAIVGGELEARADGTQYKVVYYDSLGFSVSYGRTAGPVLIVSITIQKLMTDSK
jgi:hypothetical protein